MTPINRADNVIHGITKFPDLARRLLAELSAVPSGCSNCQKNKIIRKYNSLLQDRIRRSATRRN